jgi:hypothetical protein
MMQVPGVACQPKFNIRATATVRPGAFDFEFCAQYLCTRLGHSMCVQLATAPSWKT